MEDGNRTANVLHSAFSLPSPYKNGLKGEVVVLVDLESIRCMWTYQLKDENEGKYKRNFLKSFKKKKKKI